MCLLGFSTFRGQNSVMPQFGGGSAAGSKTQKLLYLLANRQKIRSCITYAKFNPLSKLREKIWGFPLFLTSRKCYSSLIFSPNKARETEIRYVHLVGVLNVSLGGLDFSAPYHPLTTPKKWFFGWVFLFFELVLRITPLQIEERS